MANPSIQAEWSTILNEGAVSATATLPAISGTTNGLCLVAFVMYNGAGTCSPPTTVNANGITGQLVSSLGTQTRLSIAVYQFLQADLATISGQTLNSTGGSGSQKSVLVKIIQNARQEVSLNVNTGFTSSGAALSISLSRLTESLTTVIGFTSTVSTNLVYTNPARTGTLTFTSNRRVSYGDQNDTFNTSNTTVTTSGYSAVIAINIAPVSTQSIDSINSGSPIIIGSTGTITYSGFSPAPTSMLVDGDVVTLNLPNFTISPLSDAVSLPRPGVGRSVSLSNGTVSASTTHDVDVASDLDYVELSGTLYTGEFSILPPGAVVGGVMIWSNTIAGAPTGTVIFNDGNWETNLEGSQTLYYISPTGPTQQGTLITGEGGSFESISWIKATSIIIKPFTLIPINLTPF